MHQRPRRILFVAEEAGAAAYLLPVLQCWSEYTEHVVDWKVVFGKGAKRYWKRCKHLAAAEFSERISTSVREYRSILDAWVFDGLICSASPSRFECTALARAEELRVPSAVFIDTWFNYGRRWKGLQPKPNWVLVVDDSAASEAVVDGIPHGLVKVIGQPAWERTVPLPKANEKEVLFVSQPVKRYYGSDLGYCEDTAWAMVLDTWKRCPDSIENVTYSVHPDMPTPTAAQLGNARFTCDTSQALHSAGTVLGLFSSVMVDAVLAGRTVISLQPGLPSHDMCALSRQGSIPRVGSVSELIQAMICARHELDREPMKNMFHGSINNFRRFVFGEML